MRSVIGIVTTTSESTEHVKALSTAHARRRVTSGMLSVVQKQGVPRAMIDAAERPVLQDLRRTYGKTFHTWQYDKYPDLPLGPPQLMMAITKDGAVNEQLLKQRDEA